LVQAADAVVLGVTRRVHQHSQVSLDGLPHLAQNVQTIHFGQQPIQDHQVRDFLINQTQRLWAILGAPGGVTGGVNCPVIRSANSGSSSTTKMEPRMRSIAV
jgi:hypothetical protein